MFGTEAELVSGKLPLVVVRQLGGINKGVVVSISALNDLPPDLVFGFLREEAGQQVVTDSQSRFNTYADDAVLYVSGVFLHSESVKDAVFLSELHEGVGSASALKLHRNCSHC